MTPQELRNSILQRALQGKLVEQRPEEGTGEELYQQIQKEKEKLIKEGIIKKRKPLTMINDDEIPFDIPANWCWARMINICSFIGDIDHKMPKAVDEGISLLSAKDINPDGSLNYSKNVKRISLNDYERLSKKAKPQRGDIIFSRIGTLGKVGYVDTDESFLVSYSCCIIRRIIVDLRFLGICLQGPQMQYRIFEAKTGIGVPDLGMKMIHSFFVPLPPLAEQKRIASKIEELMPLVDQYEEAWNRLEELNKRFPDDLQKSILQLAIQGKLVDQRPEEGTGEQLIELILSEKTHFSKSKPIIEEDEKPFEIPNSWSFVRMDNVSALINGRAYKQNELLQSGKYPVLRVGNLFTNNSWYYSNLELDNKKYCEKGDLLYAWSASFGPFIWTGKKSIFHYHIWKIELSDHVNKKYMYYYLLADTERIKQNGHGLAMIHITKKGTEQNVFPLPPLEEQKRIVEKIEDVLPMCNSLINLTNEV